MAGTEELIGHIKEDKTTSMKRAGLARNLRGINAARAELLKLG